MFFSSLSFLISSLITVRRPTVSHAQSVLSESASLPVKVHTLDALKAAVVEAVKWSEEAGAIQVCSLRPMAGTPVVGCDCCVLFFSAISAAVHFSGLLFVCVSTVHVLFFFGVFFAGLQDSDISPELDMLEMLLNRSRSIPLQLEQLAQIESLVAAAQGWRDRASRSFLKKGASSSCTLLQVSSAPPIKGFDFFWLLNMPTVRSSSNRLMPT